MSAGAYERAVTKIGIYRDFAKYYFTMRSNLTYVNLLASGGTLVLFGKTLLDTHHPWQRTLSDDAVLYVFGAIAILVIGTWATAISCCLSNSIQAYLQMSKELEISMLSADYEPFCMRDGIEFEFATHPQDISGFVIGGIAWNGLNASVIVLAFLLIGLLGVPGMNWYLMVAGFLGSATVGTAVLAVMFRHRETPPYWEEYRRRHLSHAARIS